MIAEAINESKKGTCKKNLKFNEEEMEELYVAGGCRFWQSCYNLNT